MVSYVIREEGSTNYFFLIQEILSTVFAEENDNL